jgi:sarcosine oxidase subunit alpha
MAGRTLPLHDPITIQLDGDDVVAERGEPVAAALIAAGKGAIARSPKFHRPRGPACLRAACDGCLARVDDVPNVMTCRVAAAQGMVIKSQNTLGSREVDLLRVTDWFFPDGMNHHELFAGVPGVQQLMQSFARRVAGLGRLPGEVLAPRPARRRSVEALVVGAGPAGMAIATRLARAGSKVELIDDALEIGGGLRALVAADAGPWRSLEAALAAEVARGAVKVRPSTTAGAFYGGDLLVVGPEGAEVLTAPVVVVATGGHDGALAFEGNDVPGVMSARAGGLLLARGVRVGKRVVVVVAPLGAEAGGPFGEAFARAARSTDGRIEVEVVHGEPVSVAGSARVRSVTVREHGHGKTAGRERTIDADALLVDAPRAPAYELCEQAGAALEATPRGFVPRATAGAGGMLREGVWGLGEVMGIAFEPGAIAAAADETARSIGIARAR